jgi:hypothetical protein
VPPHQAAGFPDHGERAVAAADDGAGSWAARFRRRLPRGARVDAPGHNAKNVGAVFAQILGKLNYFNLCENLQLILFDYEEKRSCTTNGAFKSAC